MNNLRGKIIDQINLKKSEGFRYLYNHYYSALCSFSSKIVKNRSEAEDLVQELFVKIWKEKINFSSLKSMTSFLFISVKNASLNYNRNQSKKIKIDFSEIYNSTEIEITDRTVIQLMIEEEYYRQLYVAINKLTPKRKKVLLLSMEGLSYKEIADATGISVNTVKTLKQNSYKFLREELEYPVLLFLFSQKIIS